MNRKRTGLQPQQDQNLLRKKQRDYSHNSSPVKTGILAAATTVFDKACELATGLKPQQLLTNNKRPL